MMQKVLQNFDLAWVPISALLLFLFCFAIYTFYTYKKSNKDYYEKAALIPLEDAKNHLLKNGEI